MKIDVTHISRSFGRQTRAYAEYRIFSSLAAFSNVVRQVTVSLTSGATGRSMECSVLIGLQTGVPLQVTARGRHAYDAINRAAVRLAPALRRHAHVAVPSR